MRGIDLSTFKSRMRRVVEVCGLAKVLGMDIRNLSHGYRQRVGLGQALVHDPPILILDEPTSDLDPNEKAEVIRYIQEIGKNRTILLSTHNLNEVEAACARAIIVSKGRVVADGPLDDIRARSGKVKYVVVVHEKKALGDKKPPTAEEIEAALQGLPDVVAVRELPTDDSAHAFQMVGPLGSDIRADIYRLGVEKGWLLLEIRRESQTLEDVFKALTRGDERFDRGRAMVEDDENDPFAPTAGIKPAGEDEDEDEDEDEGDESEAKSGEDGDSDEDADDDDAKSDADDDSDAEGDEDEDDGDDEDESDEDEDRPAAKKG
jgi:ABC-2 type transport system ATP-binding protein